MTTKNEPADWRTIALANAWRDWLGEKIIDRGVDLPLAIERAVAKALAEDGLVPPGFEP